MLQIVNQLIPL